MFPSLSAYDRFVVGFSGGKDSLACLLHLLDSGVDRSRIELWHHEIDGREGSALMDWPSTPAYCRRVAAALEVPIYFSWKIGGFEREMLRYMQTTAGCKFEMPGGEVGEAGGKSNSPGCTRNAFPQVIADLTTRWCSAYLKIDVGVMALRNQPRFNHSKTLFVTGERAQESPARARRGDFENHKADARSGKLGRHIDHWRPVHSWTTEQVWNIVRAHGILPHPAYRLGWGRLSCMKCIFGSAAQWATVRQIDPEGFELVARYEEQFGITIQRECSVRQLAEMGTPYPAATVNPDLVKQAMNPFWDEPVLILPGQWQLPAGAFGESCGPL